MVEASTSRHFLFLYKANSIEVGHEGFLHLIHQLLGKKSLSHVTRMLPILYIPSFKSPIVENIYFLVYLSTISLDFYVLSMTGSDLEISTKRTRPINTVRKCEIL